MSDLHFSTEEFILLIEKIDRLVTGMWEFGWLHNIFIGYHQ